MGVVGRDEDDMAQALDAPRQLQPVEAGQADVDEDDVGPQLQHQSQAALAVLGLGQQLQLRPELGQAFAQALARQGLVFDDQCGWMLHSAAGVGSSMRAQTPPSARCWTLRRAASP